MAKKKVGRPKGKTGQPKTPGSGRKKGTPNRLTADVKAMVLEALNDVGGAEYLAEQARKENPAPFLTLVGRVLPMQVEGTADDGSINIKIGFK